MREGGRGWGERETQAGGHAGLGRGEKEAGGKDADAFRGGAHEVIWRADAIKQLNRGLCLQGKLCVLNGGWV